MSNVKVMTGGNAPENLTGEIRRFHPGLVILIDAVHMGGLPGETRLFEPDEVEGVSFSTHGMPLCVLAGFLRVSVGADVIILGIQAGSLELMGPLSGSVASSVETAALLLKEAVLEQFSG
jgi:hydrogenase 3 maturation protease